MLLGKGWVCLQDSAFAEEVEEVSIGSILNGDVQVAWGAGGGWAHGALPSKEEYTARQGLWGWGEGRGGQPSPLFSQAPSKLMMLG